MGFVEGQEKIGLLTRTMKSSLSFLMTENSPNVSKFLAFYFWQMIISLS
jgi:hypothetical protein